jgi:hypothetical protein
MSQRTLAFRIFGHGVVAGRLPVASVAVSGSIATLTFGVTSAVNWSTRAWSFVLVRGCGPFVPDGRYPVTGGSTAVVSIVAPGATPGSPSAGLVALDDCYTFCERIPSGVGSDTATRWAPWIIDASNTVGSRMNIVGGVAESEGLTMSIAYASTAAVSGLCRSVPTPLFTTSGVALALAQQMVRELVTESPDAMETGIPVASWTLLDADVAEDTGQIWIDAECVRVDGIPATGELDVTRGVLGTRISGHSIGVPLSVGIPSPVGRQCELTVYDSDTDPGSVVYRLTGEITGRAMDTGATAIRLEISTDSIRPKVKRPGVASQGGAQYVRRAYGEHSVLILQANPDSYWSWCEFGSIAVRIRRRLDWDPVPEIDGTAALGFTLCAYEMPQGLVERCVVISDPDVSRDDAARLLGAGRYYAENDGGFFPPDYLPASVGSAALDVSRDGSWWTRTGGGWRTDGSGLYDLHEPRPIHIVELPGVHAAAIEDPIFQNVTPGISIDFRAAIAATSAARQILISTGGSIDGLGGPSGADDLLPAELSCAIDPDLVVVRYITAESVLGRVVLRLDEDSLADAMTDQVLKPGAITLTQTSEGLTALVSITTLTRPNVTASLSDADILSDPGQPPDIEGPTDAVDQLITSYTIKLTTIADADVLNSSARTRTEVYAGAATFTAGGGSYGVAGITVDLTAWDDSTGLAASFVQQSFGVLRQELSVTVLDNAEIQPGAVLSVNFPQIPGPDGLRGFVGLALVLSRVTEIRNGTARVRMLLLSAPAYGIRAWAPGLPVHTPASATSFTLDTSENIHLPATSTTGAELLGPAFTAGDKVDIYTENMTLRSTTTPGTVATYNDTTGAMTLSVAASDGSPVVPVASDIVTLALKSQQPGGSRAADDFAYLDTGSWGAS